MNPKSRVILIYIANTPCISRKSSSYSECVQNLIVADVDVFMIPLLWFRILLLGSALLPNTCQQSVPASEEIVQLEGGSC